MRSSRFLNKKWCFHFFRWKRYKVDKMHKHFIISYSTCLAWHFFSISAVFDKLTSYLVTTMIDFYQTFVKMCLRGMRTATKNGRRSSISSWKNSRKTSIRGDIFALCVSARVKYKYAFLERRISKLFHNILLNMKQLVKFWSVSSLDAYSPKRGIRKSWFCSVYESQEQVTATQVKWGFHVLF